VGGRVVGVSAGGSKVAVSSSVGIVLAVLWQAIAIMGIIKRIRRTFFMLYSFCYVNDIC
jgi:hypothetical protein